MEKIKYLFHNKLMYMNILGVIPSRFSSSRFPGKPLIDIKGKSMIHRVYAQAMQCKMLNEVIVATDDSRIMNEVKLMNGNAMLTASNHYSGTDRCAEVLIKSKVKYDAVVNIQGDEPFINPVQIDEVCKLVAEKETQIATLVKKITSNEELFNPSKPKVVLNNHNEALYFSRSAIPHIRGVLDQHWIQKTTFYKHIGIYAYRADILLQLTKINSSTLEELEQLEQLRWLQNGYRIKCGITEHESHAIDTPADLEKVLGNMF